MFVVISIRYYMSVHEPPVPTNISRYSINGLIVYKKMLIVLLRTSSCMTHLCNYNTRTGDPLFFPPVASSVIILPFQGLISCSMTKNSCIVNPSLVTFLVLLLIVRVFVRAMRHIFGLEMPLAPCLSTP